MNRFTWRGVLQQRAIAGFQASNASRNRGESQTTTSAPLHHPQIARPTMRTRPLPITDKATFEFIVSTPAHYQVVASGRLVEETDLPGNRRLFHWRTAVPLPTKVAVIGAARFAVQHLGEVRGIPVSTWVYPQDRDAGFYDFKLGEKVLDYFVERQKILIKKRTLKSLKNSRNLQSKKSTMKP